MALEHESHTLIAKLVRDAGSQSAFARLVGKNQSTVYEWLRAGRVSHKAVVEVAELTKTPLHDLRPDIYPREGPAEASASARFEAAR